MKVNQRDIVELVFPLPNGKQVGPHPAIVLSVREVTDTEDIFYAVMLSTKESNEDFIFELKPEMLTHTSDKKGFVKCQLIEKFMEREVIRKQGSIKPEYFKLLLTHINNVILGNECK